MKRKYIIAIAFSIVLALWLYGIISASAGGSTLYLPLVANDSNILDTRTPTPEPVDIIFDIIESSNDRVLLANPLAESLAMDGYRLEVNFYDQAGKYTYYFPAVLDPSIPDQIAVDVYNYDTGESGRMVGAVAVYDWYVLPTPFWSNSGGGVMMLYDNYGRLIDTCYFLDGSGDLQCYTVDPNHVDRN